MAVTFLDELKAAGFVPDGHVQYAILSTCGDEERPSMEKALECSTEEVMQTAWAALNVDRRRPYSGRAGGSLQGQRQAVGSGSPGEDLPSD